MEKYILKTTNLDKSFKVEGVKQKVLDNVDLEVVEGEFVVLVGPSGCGKSTYLRLISDLMKPESGKIELKKNSKISFVFQSFGLFPWLNVKENVAFGLKMAGVKKQERDAQVAPLLAEVGLSEFEYKHPKELSGGMKQRVGIARAISLKPNILILDEPFSALDTFAAAKLRSELLDIWKKQNLTIIMVSHLIEEAVELADRVVVFAANPGRIEKTYEVNLPRPRNVRSPELFKLVDSIEAEIVKGSAEEKVRV